LSGSNTQNCFRLSALTPWLVLAGCSRQTPPVALVLDAGLVDVPAISVAPTPAPPPYDLATDTSSRIAKARAELGAEARVVVERGVFVFVGPQGNTMFDGAVHLAHDALEAYFNGRFSTPPEHAVVVYLFSSTPAYVAFCDKHFGAKCGTSLGLYRRASREIILDLSPGLPTLTHELVHPIVQRDFPSAPAWLDEGLGALYENPVFPRPGEIHGATNWRHPRLLAALTSKTERSKARLEVLFSMSDTEFRGPDEDLHYAMARELCQWLDSRGQLWPFYRAWRDSRIAEILSDAGTPALESTRGAVTAGSSVFLRIVGETPEQADAEWVKWVRGER
jgi:hypothetical protein